MKVRAIRGATTVENTSDSIRECVAELLFAIIRENEIGYKDICFVDFSSTKDINAEYPAKYARLDCGFENVPMMCYQEMDVRGSLKNCIRVMMVVNSEKSQTEIKHKYLRGAAILRTDLKHN